MKAVFDSYIDNAFGSRVQAEVKKHQFEVNYHHFFPADRNCKCLSAGTMCRT